MKNLFVALGGLALIGGASIGLANSHKETMKAEATNDTWYLKGSFNSWTKQAMTETPSDSDIWLMSNVSIPANGEFGICDGSDNQWQGAWSFNNGPTESGVRAKFTTNGNNVKCSTAGAYDIYFYGPAYTGSATKYTMKIEDSEVEPVFVDVTLEATFSVDVPEYADIFAPGDFNSWDEVGNSAKMTRVNARTFTLDLVDIAPSTYGYKLVAEYTGGTGITWEHEIDASDQSVVISDTDDNDTVSLGTARNYDFATKMPNNMVQEGAEVQITFKRAISSNVNLYFVSDINGWGAGTLASKLMATTDRKTFSYVVPNGTHAGTGKEFKITMQRTGDAALSYDYLAYSNGGNNATIDMPADTAVFPITATEDQTGYVEYVTTLFFSIDFVDSMEAICGTTSQEWAVDHSGSALNTAWSNASTEFDKLSATSKAKFGSDNQTDIAQARSLYLHCVDRYKLSEWTDAPEAQRMNMVSTDNNALLVIVLVSTLAVSAFAAFYFLRKRKEVK